MARDYLYLAPFIAVLAFALTEVLCTDRTLTRPVSFPNNTNTWQKQQYQQLPLVNNDNSRQWSGRRQTTTPWPRLGSSGQVLASVPSGGLVWNWQNPTQQNLSWNRPFFLPSGPRTNVSTPTEKYEEFGFQEIENLAPGDATDEELRAFSEMMLKRDVNNANKYVEARFQGKTTSWSKNDEAPQPLLRINNQVYDIPTVVKLKKLYDNYVVEANVDEEYTAQEKAEENEFLEAVASTPVMQLTRKFLAKKGKIQDDQNEFKNLLRRVWFDLYSRGGNRLGSSGFEHVFAAEIKKGQVSGFHNWLYFSEEEAKQQVDYLGYLKILSFGDKGAILKLHFVYKGVDKPVGSMFVGTSPEFEMALYTTCFVLRADRVCPLKLDDRRFIIRTFTYRYRGQSMIGSAFPEI